MTDPLSCGISTVVDGPQLGAPFDQDSGEWILPCQEPVYGIARNGYFYCCEHLALVTDFEAPLLTA